VHEFVRLSLDPEAEPEEATRRVPPDIQPHSLRAALEACGAQAAEAVAALRERCAVTLTLLERARELDSERSEVERLQREAREAQLEATESVGRRNEAAQRLEDVAATWHSAVLQWSSAGPLATIERAEELVPPALADLTADVDAARGATERAAAWLRGRLPVLHAEVDRAGRGVAELDRRMAESEDELNALRAGVDPEPALPVSDVDRDPASGAAFFRLVDFAPSLSPEQRAGCEAALESSGLLNAWVTADGTLTDAASRDLTAIVVCEKKVCDVILMVTLIIKLEVRFL
jgi:hypothetical protein